MDCFNGHTLAAVGTNAQGKCKQCGRDAQARWREKHPGHGAANSAKSYGKRRVSFEGRARMLITDAKRRAKARGRDFSLSLEWLVPKMQAGICELTGLPLDMEFEAGRNRSPFGPSLDRRDSKKGYTTDNTRLVCWAANCALSDFGEEVFAMVARGFLRGLT